MEEKMTIAQARKQIGLSQAKCAEYLQMPKRTLESWEMGERKCPPYVERLVIEEILRYKEKTAGEN